MDCKHYKSLPTYYKTKFLAVSVCQKLSDGSSYGFSPMDRVIYERKGKV